MFHFGRRKQEQAQVSVGSKDFAKLLTGSLEYPALANSAFWSCVTKLCVTYATLPLHLFHDTGHGAEVIRRGGLYELLRHPNRYQTSYQFRFVMAFNFELYGRAYAIIERTILGIPYALYPVSPNAMSWVERADGSYGWICSSTGSFVDSHDVLVLDHYPVGLKNVLSPLEYADGDINVSTHNKDLQDSFFKRGTTIGGTVTVPKGTSQEVKDQIKQMFLSNYSGASNAYSIAVLEDNVKYEPIKLNPSDTNALITAQGWTLQEVARRFGVPPFWVGDLSKATYANSEQQGMDLVTYALQPRMIAWEDGFAALCGEGEYVKFNLAGLMRGDHATRAAYYHQGIMDGWLSINEVRALEDMNSIGPDGDKHYFPLNYTTIDKVGEGYGGGYGEKKEQSLSHMEEKKIKEKVFISEVKAVTASSRQKIEKVIRTQLKAEIAYLKSLKGCSASDISTQFAQYCKDHEADYGVEFQPVFEEIMNRLLPIVQKQSGITSGVPQNSMDSYACSYANHLAGRLNTSRANAVADKLKGVDDSEVEEDIDDICDDWLANSAPAESDEESHRAGNAFNVYLYASLGIQYMHVAAAADACEFCHEIDGKVVEVNGTVFAKGTDVTDGSGNVRTIHKSMKHPPWHTHCQCVVVPGK